MPSAAYRIRSSGTALRLISDWKVRDSGLIVRTIQHAKVRNPANLLKVFYSTLAVASDYNGYQRYDYVTTGYAGGWPVTQTSVPFTAHVTGGLPPYTYAWERVSGDATINILSPAAATTLFQTSISGPPGSIKDATFRCKVTDSLGAVSYGARDGTDSIVTIHVGATA